MNKEERKIRFVTKTDIINDIASIIHLDFPDRKNWNGRCFDDMSSKYKAKLRKIAREILEIYGD